MYKKMVNLTSLFFVSLWSLSAPGGTCSTISRSAYTTGQVLTSTSLNSQLNAIYAPFNSASGAADGGCIADGTLEDGALNTTDFAVPLNAIQQGCKVEYVSASQINIDKCRASVNGNWVVTTATTSLSMGCGSCDVETASDEYWVYILTGSVGSTLNAAFKTTAPNDDGYNGSGDLALGRIWNDGASDIASDGITQWHKNEIKGAPYYLWLSQCNGYGSTATHIRRLSIQIKAIGDTDVTWTDDATNASTFTINTTGVYAFQFTSDVSSSGSFGFSKNSSNVTTTIGALDRSERLTMVTAVNSGDRGTASWTGPLYAGDVIRIHTDSVTNSNAAICSLHITRIH